MLKTNRGLFKFIFLSIITFGIYYIVVFCNISSSINAVASKHDNKHTMHFALVCFLFSWLTFGLLPFIWEILLCARIGDELVRRRIPYRFGAGTFWGWGIFGSLIFVGPFIYTYKLLKSMNYLCEDYNEKGE